MRDNSSTDHLIFIYTHFYPSELHVQRMVDAMYAVVIKL